MPGLLPDVDPDGLLEYSVVYTDRSLNHMSKRFQGVMRDLSATLKRVYNAHAVAIVPGSGTFGMEAVARQFAGGAKCLVIRNGWFSFRWTQIFEMGNIPSESVVLKARQLEDHAQSPFAPAPIEPPEIVDLDTDSRRIERGSADSAPRIGAVGPHRSERAVSGVQRYLAETGHLHPIALAA